MPKRKVDDYYNNIGISNEHYDDEGTYWFTSDNGKRIGIKKGQNLEQALDDSGIPDDGKDYSDVTASDIANQEDDSQDDGDSWKPYGQDDAKTDAFKQNQNQEDGDGEQANKREEASKWDEIKKEEITDETKKWSYKFARSKYNTDKKKPRELQEKQTKYDKLKNFDYEIWDENNFESGKDVYTRDGMSKYKKAIDNKLGGNLKFIDEEIEEWLTDENHHSLNQAVNELKSGIKDGEIEDWWDNSNEESKAKVLGDISYWDNKERKEKLNQSYDDSVMQSHIRLMYAINKKTEGEAYYGYGSATGRMSPAESWNQMYLGGDVWTGAREIDPELRSMIREFEGLQWSELPVDIQELWKQMGNYRPSGESIATESQKLECPNCGRNNGMWTLDDGSGDDFVCVWCNRGTTIEKVTELNNLSQAEVFNIVMEDEQNPKTHDFWNAGESYAKEWGYEDWEDKYFEFGDWIENGEHYGYLQTCKLCGMRHEAHKIGEQREHLINKHGFSLNELEGKIPTYESKTSNCPFNPNGENHEFIKDENSDVTCKHCGEEATDYEVKLWGESKATESEKLECPNCKEKGGLFESTFAKNGYLCEYCDADITDEAIADWNDVDWLDIDNLLDAKESKATELSPEAPCPKCGSYKTILEGKSSLGYGKRRQYVCTNCYNVFQSEHSPKEIKAMYRDGTSPYDRNRYWGESKATEDYDYEPKLDCLNCDGKGCGDCHGTGIYGESKATEQQFVKSSQVFKNYNYPDNDIFAEKHLEDEHGFKIVYGESKVGNTDWSKVGAGFRDFEYLNTKADILELIREKESLKTDREFLEGSGDTREALGEIDSDIAELKRELELRGNESKYTIEDDFDESDQNDGEIQEKYVRGYENDWKDKLDAWDGRAVSDNFTTVQPYDPVNPKYECIYCGKEFSWDDTFTHDGSHGTLPSPYEDMGNT